MTDLEIGLARADEPSPLQEIEGRAGDLFRAHPVTAALSLSVTPIERLERGRAESMLWVAREEGRAVGFALVEDSGSAHHLEDSTSIPRSVAGASVDGWSRRSSRRPRPATAQSH